MDIKGSKRLFVILVILVSFSLVIDFISLNTLYGIANNKSFGEAGVLASEFPYGYDYYSAYTRNSDEEACKIQVSLYTFACKSHAWSLGDAMAIEDAEADCNKYHDMSMSECEGDYEMANLIGCIYDAGSTRRHCYRACDEEDEECMQECEEDYTEDENNCNWAYSSD